jgi:predicted DNA repair protein MutK
MSGGLVALLDDVAALAKLAAASLDDIGAAAGKAGTKAMGVVVDDAAVTPRYVHGFRANRELPIIKRIAIGSIRNKLVFILPAIMVLSEFLPWVLTPILMLGGLYLSYEGAEKVWELVSGHDEETPDVPAAAPTADHEDTMVRGAITTDFILSAEIMVISLNEVRDEGFVSRLFILALVALGITALVYGAVAVIVKMDDIGLHLAQRDNGATQALGRALVKGMPIVMKVLSTVGIAAMLWVGGHILLNGTHELGWNLLYDLVHHAEVAVAEATGALGGFLGWLTNTLASALLGLTVGAIAVAVMHLVPRRKGAAKAH